MALDRKSDPGGIKKETTDRQRDLAAKGGPAVGLGDAQNRQVPAPGEDLQTRAAAASAGTAKKQQDHDKRDSGSKH